MGFLDFLNLMNGDPKPEPTIQEQWARIAESEAKHGPIRRYPKPAELLDPNGGETWGSGSQNERQSQWDDE